MTQEYSHIGTEELKSIYKKEKISFIASGVFHVTLLLLFFTRKAKPPPKSKKNPPT